MMKERTLRVLEFTKIRDMLTEKALTDLGAEKCQALVPSTNFQEVTAWQEETEEALVVLTYLGGHPMAPFTDVRPYLNLCDKGATLSPKALLEIAGLMRACRTARAALVTDRENTPRLKEKAGLLGSFRNLEDDITNTIISEDEKYSAGSPPEIHRVKILFSPFPADLPPAFRLPVSSCPYNTSLTKK